MPASSRLSAPPITVNDTDPATTLAALVTQAIVDVCDFDNDFAAAGPAHDAACNVMFDRITATVDALSYHPPTTADAALTQAAALVGLIDLFSGDAVNGGAPQHQLDTAERLAAGLLVFIQSSCGAKNEHPSIVYFCGASRTERVFPHAVAGEVA